MGVWTRGGLGFLLLFFSYNRMCKGAQKHISQSASEQAIDLFQCQSITTIRRDEAKGVNGVKRGGKIVAQLFANRCCPVYDFRGNVGIPQAWRQGLVCLMHFSVDDQFELGVGREW